MIRCRRINAKPWVLACFLVCGLAHGDKGLMDRVGSIFDNIGQGFSFVGKKATDLIGPGLGFGDKDGAEVTQVHQFNERFPVGPAPRVSISSEFGEIRVATWANQVVEVTAEISIGAESGALAEDLARAIDIDVVADDDRIEIRTRLPDTRRTGGHVSITVFYAVTVPEDAALVVENSFGDTFVRGVGGSLGVNSQYGVVDLRDIGGAVQVRSRGEFALEAHGLAQGGAFELNGAHAVFSDVAGVLQVSNFHGPIEVRNPAAEVEWDITNESGAILLDLPQDAAPDLVATTLFGEITSDVALTHSSQGNLTVARRPNADSSQHVALRTSFGDIHIRQAGAESVAGPALVEGTAPFKDALEFTEPLAQGTELRVEAIAGDVHIEGVDEDRLYVTATKLVRVQDPADARAALEALVVQIDKQDGRLTVRSRLIDDMTALGCPAYRVDFHIRCPRTTPIVVQAEDGHTAVAGTGEAIRVDQTAGAVTVEHTKGVLQLTNHEGGVAVRNCAGPVEVTARYGPLELNQVYGAVTATCEHGRTVIEALHDAGATVYNRNGDVRIIALDGIFGDYDVKVEQGGVSILLPTAVDATFQVVAENGTVYSGIPLNGTIDRGIREFHGRLNKGTHQVTLQTKDGDIRIN